MMHKSGASSKVFEACFVQSQGPLSWNLSTEIQELKTAWYSISQTVQTNALVKHGDWPLCAVIKWSHSSLCTAAVQYILSWPSSTQIWIDSHLIACSFWLLLLLVLHTLFIHASWVILSVATIAASQCTTWCLCCCCVSQSSSLCEAPVVRLTSAPIAPGGSVWGAMPCCCDKWGRWSQKEMGSAEDYLVSYRSKLNEWQPTYTLNSCWIMLHIAAGDSNGCAISISRFNIVCLFIRIHQDEPQLMSHIV